ncbi:SGNH/GDSL hydrolase family protein [Trujillonella endophytica]|uniref:Lysophospholipase L1 n=1 Tax=Trujillonella endophytica TaxID=673521 RepID=A0A1H8WHW6_9ACTN|nr:GDSL-type esterase/lipase family protein [Trujillella endophytica]SEP27255.1 Lysophospholipase L1 [Trujillella endophytica]
MTCTSERSAARPGDEQGGGSGKSRRTFFARGATLGLGIAAVGGVVGGSVADAAPVLPQPPQFDSATSVYNLKGANTRRTRAALALARLGAGVARIGFLGDSVTAGTGTTRGTSDPVTLLRQQFARAKFRTGELVHLYSAAPEPRVTYAGTWADQSINVPWRRGQAGATLTFSGVGRYLELVVSNESVTGFTTAIDGGAPVSHTTTGALTYKTMTLDAGTDGAHTLVLKLAGNSFVYGVGIRHADGVVVENAGISGAATANFLASFGSANVMSAASYFDVDTFLVELGANDMYQAVPVATYKTNLLAIVDKCLASGANVVLVATHTPAGNSGWPPYLAAQYEIADLRDLPLLDLTDRMGWLGTAGDFDGTPYDLAVPDGKHLTAVGNSVKAMAWLDVLGPIGTGTQP